MPPKELQEPKDIVDMPGSDADAGEVSLEDQVMLIMARLMEGGQDDEDTCRSLDKLTKLLTDEPDRPVQGRRELPPLHDLVDSDCFDTILGFLDMRKGALVRGHARLTVSTFLKASEQRGTEYLGSFFKTHITKGTYDDFLVAFSVAASIFPIAPAISAELFLSEGFVNSLGPLMRRKWKSRKVEQACLEMLNVACMHSACRDAIQKYCTEWLEEIVAECPPNITSSVDATFGTQQQKSPHSEVVRNLAAVVLAKLSAISLTSSGAVEERIQPVSTGIEDLADIFSKVLALEDKTDSQSSIEGLAYASLQPKVKEKLASDPTFLKNLLQALQKSPAKSASTYGALSILANLTSYLPALSEEQKRISQLKAYANASQPAQKPDLLNDEEHVAKRGKAVFDAGAIPILVTHSQHGSGASLGLVVSIVFALSKNVKIRGQIAQQGGVKLLLQVYPLFPDSGISSRRTTAHALARILISTNPMHVFGGSNPLSLTSSIRPLLSLLADDPNTEQRDLLPTFESLLALTNLASTDDSARNPIIRWGWSSITELLLSNNTMVTRATVELICNLMQSPEGVAKFADGSKQASHMMHILLALSDSQDFATRRAAGGALASLTEWDAAVNAILERDRGVKLLLSLCTEEEEELRHRGVVCLLNVISAPGKVGEWGLSKVKEDGGVEALKECLKRGKSQEVLELAVEALKKIIGKD